MRGHYGPTTGPPRAHHGAITRSVSFMRTGRAAAKAGTMRPALVSGSRGLETGAPICTFNCEGIVPCAAVAPDGRTFVAGGAAGRVSLVSTVIKNTLCDPFQRSRPNDGLPVGIRIGQNQPRPIKTRGACVVERRSSSRSSKQAAYKST